MTVASVVPTADGRADLVRLWNPGTRAIRVGFSWGRARARTIRMSPPFEERGSPAPVRISVPAQSSVTVRIERPAGPR